MANIVSYTNKDFVALQYRLRQLIKTQFPNWDTEAVASFGNILLDAFAYVGDVINYYADANSREAFVSTASLFQSMIRFAEQYGIDLPLQSPASVDVRFTAKASYTEDILIPKGTIVSTGGEDPLRFRTMADAVLSAGNTEVIITCNNTEEQTDVIYPTGSSWFEAWLSKSPFLDIVDVTDNLGNFWTRIDNLIDSTNADRHFEILVNSNGYARLRFGDGVQGMIPDAELTVRYETGGGEIGNIPAGTIKVLESQIFKDDGVSVDFDVVNTDKASGGANRISVNQARMFIPASFRTQHRTVSKQDFIDNALKVQGVARATILTSNEDPGIMENEGHLIIIPEGGGNPSQALKNGVLNMVTVENPCPITFLVTIFDPNYKQVNIEAKVYFKQGVDVSETVEQIKEDLQDLFKISRATGDDFLRFGGDYVDRFGNPDPALPQSPIQDVIDNNANVRKIRYCRLNGNNSDLPLRYREFPILSNITIIDGDTGTIY